MNILFMTLGSINSIFVHGIYTDLIREFDKNGHRVYVITPVDGRFAKKYYYVKESNTTIIKPRVGNNRKTNIIEKGINTVLIGATFKSTIKKCLSDVKFDLVLYSTPPITFLTAIEYVKNRDGARTYLMLKDIFPQNAVDIGLMKKTGVKGLLYRHFRKQEMILYQISDKIGCMSPANVRYVIRHNKKLDPGKVGICPNAIEVIDISVGMDTRDDIRLKHDIPLDKVVFVYGGNLGKPQGIPFLIKCIKNCYDIEDAFFLIIGDGTEYNMLEEFVRKERPENAKLLKELPKEDYENMVGACDVGLIFLDHRFTIPNFPSRMLSYMQSKLPILACTDPNTDVGKTIIDGGFGWWCESNDPKQFAETVKQALKSDRGAFGENGYEFLLKNYSVIDVVKDITGDFQEYSNK